MQNEKYIDQNFNCPIVKFINLISGKWAIPILYRLIITNKPIRFGELKRAISPITQKELTKQLRLFEQKGLISRKLYPEVPPKVEYQITELGKTLKPVLNSIANWMEQHEKELL
ncbi:HxlR family transcriptional regulator [Snodgrassella alvi]|uniref:HxlR family transcriptional regulator n=1 Tax=Snodgrassella alvi TaxID=1196083 RepID=A0A2N9WUI1_9NEIS|nr:helix-turn-helix domain-containing protein [Snodgrassella alvi]PIT16255.1 HxlR family transcriptional regulator [Snodgrassella alvi]